MRTVLPGREQAVILQQYRQCPTLFKSNRGKYLVIKVVLGFTEALRQMLTQVAQLSSWSLSTFLWFTDGSSFVSL